MRASSQPFWALRMRNGFEAADCGILIWRERPLLLLLFFAIPAVLIAILVYNMPLPFYYKAESFSAKALRYACAAGALWWFKPLFDRFTLQTIAKLFFNKNASVKEIARSFFPSVFRGLAGDLTWRRFSPLRGATLPLRILEQVKRKTFKARKETLLNGGLSFTLFLTALCAFMEIIFLISSFVFIFTFIMLFNIDLTLNSGQSIFDSPVVTVILTLCFINFCIVETLWMAMSFAVYINSRVITEGWDLEIIFKELSLRKKYDA